MNKNAHFMFVWKKISKIISNFIIHNNLKCNIFLRTTIKNKLQFLYYVYTNLKNDNIY